MPSRTRSPRSSSLVGATAARVGAAVGGLALAVNAAVHLGGAHIDESSVHSGAEYTVLLSFVVALVALSPPIVELAARAGRVRIGHVAAAGQLMLAAICVVSAVNGGDTAAFNVVAPLGNVLWLGGWVWLAVRSFRVGALSKAGAVAIPLSWIFALPMARFGGGLLAAAVWFAVAYALADAPFARARPATSGSPALKPSGA